MRMLGFEACKTMIPFTRYVNERNDIGMRDWMQEYWEEDLPTTLYNTLSICFLGLEPLVGDKYSWRFLSCLRRPS